MNWWPKPSSSHGPHEHINIGSDVNIYFQIKKENRVQLSGNALKHCVIFFHTCASGTLNRDTCVPIDPPAWTVCKLWPLTCESRGHHVWHWPAVASALAEDGSSPSVCGYDNLRLNNFVCLKVLLYESDSVLFGGFISCLSPLLWVFFLLFFLLPQGKHLWRHCYSTENHNTSCVFSQSERIMFSSGWWVSGVLSLM